MVLAEKNIKSNPNREDREYKSPSLGTPYLGEPRRYLRTVGARKIPPIARVLDMFSKLGMKEEIPMLKPNIPVINTPSTQSMVKFSFMCSPMIFLWVYNVNDGLDFQVAPSRIVVPMVSVLYMDGLING